MPAPYDGGCVCGAVRYRLTEEPLTFYACHCTDCRGHAGAAYGISMMVRRDALAIVHGTAHTYDVEASDGRRRRGVGCAACMTRLWGEPPRVPTVRILRPGTLDDPQGFRPVAHIWTRSKLPWVVIPADEPVFEQQPPDPRALVDLWRARHPR